MNSSNFVAKALMGNQVTPPTSLLQGYDTFTGNGRSTALTGTTSTSGGAESSDYTTCTSLSSLTNSLKMSAELSASGLFGSVDAKTDFLKSMNLTSTSVIVSIYANCGSVVTSCSNAQLNPNVAAPQADELNQWYLGYGDSYVSSITTGAEYIACYVFYCQSTSEQTDITAQLSANGVTGANQVSANVTSALSSLQESVTTRTAFHQTLTGMTGIDLPTSENIAAFALSFASKTPNPGTITNFTTTGYENAPGIGSVFAPIVETRNAFIAPLTNGGIGQTYQYLVSLNNAAAWLQDVYSTFGYNGDGVLIQNSGQIVSDLSTVADAVTQISQDATQVPSLPDLQSLSYGIPTINFSGPDPSSNPVTWGPPPPNNQNYESFQDATYNSMLNQTYLSSISLAGQYDTDDNLTMLYMVTLVFISGDGNSQTVVHGVQTDGYPWSSTDGLLFPPGSFVSNIVGATLNSELPPGAIASLAITSSGPNGSSISWPTGGDPNGDPPVTWNPANCEVLVGFSGQTCSGLLQNISPQVVIFSPANWIPNNGV